ncbi:MAG: carbohydrate-binding family 9-like protein [Christensenellales bacterium]|jgi:hypothetical protein
MYRIQPVKGAFQLPKGEFDPGKFDFMGTEDAQIALYPWDEVGYTPEAHARVGWNEDGLHVLMYAKEETTQGTVTETGGQVCVDSCLEFFFMPFPKADARYLNCECNVLGTMHIGMGVGRSRPNGRRLVEKELPRGMKVSASGHYGAWWAVSYTVPMSFLEGKFGETLKSGNVLRGNFYKCDESIHPHFGTWAPVSAEKPDFHRPECFAEMVLA